MQNTGLKIKVTYICLNDSNIAQVFIVIFFIVSKVFCNYAMMNHYCAYMKISRDLPIQIIAHGIGYLIFKLTYVLKKKRTKSSNNVNLIDF